MTYTALTVETNYPVSGELQYVGFQAFIVRQEPETTLLYAVQEETIKKEKEKEE